MVLFQEINADLFYARRLFLAFSCAIASTVLLMDNLASGNNCFDSFIKVLYLSCVSDTFLYLVISVMCSFPFVLNYNIGYSLKSVKMKIVTLTIIICSALYGNCQQPHTKNVEFLFNRVFKDKK